MDCVNLRQRFGKRYRIRRRRRCNKLRSVRPCWTKRRATFSAGRIEHGG